MSVFLCELLDSIYSFIEHELLPDFGWSEFGSILVKRKQHRSLTGIYTDTFPSLACLAAGGKIESSIPLAAAWVLYVLAGRMFDDFQDEVEEARQFAPLGLFAIGTANVAMSRIDASSETVTDIISAFGKAMAFAAKGQSESCSLDSLTLEWYFNNLAARTAVIFATASWCGARLSSPAPDLHILDALYNYGTAVGMATQIIDDCQDLADSDIASGKYTLPVIYALSLQEHSHYLHLKVLLSESDKSPAQVSEIIGILETMGAIEWSLKMASVYRVKAVQALDILPISQKGHLLKLVTRQADDL